MSKPEQRQAGVGMQTKNIFSRRDFVRFGGLVAAFAASTDMLAAAPGRPPVDEGSAIRLGVASYTFRNFNRAQMVSFMKHGGYQASRGRDHLLPER